MRLKKQTKLFKWLLPLMLVLMLPQIASAHDFEVDGIYYYINGNNATVTYRGTGASQYSNEYTGAVSIPSTVTYSGKTYSVTEIGWSAFEYCSGLTSVTIPNSVTEIGLGAFEYCSGLTSVTIPNSVTSIGPYAFSGCSGLTSVTIPNSVTEIDDETFSHCSGLTSVTIPNSVTEIGHNAFWDCTGLTSLAIPNSVNSIGESAFHSCSGLTTVIIPNSVTSIGAFAFYNCTGLTSIIVESGNTKYDSRNNCNAIIETATNTLVIGCMNTFIPNSVTSISVSAFGGCTSLTSVTIPNSVTSIGPYAFSGCSGLTSVTIPNSVTEIGYNAFDGCSGLTSVTIPNSVRSIGPYAFDGCTGLTSLTIPNSASIGDYAFCDRTRLTSLTLTGQGAWYNKSNMPSISQIKTLNIGSGITSLDSFGFTPDTVNCYATTPPTCSYSSYSSYSTFNNYDGELHVPASSLASYFMADYWQNFNNMVNDITDKVTLDKTNANLVQWETLALTATVAPEECELLWSSSNPSVATVDENGLVTATGDGGCYIFASLASNPAVYACCHISSTCPEISLSLTLNIDEAIVGVNQMLTVYPSCSPDVPVELIVTSSDPSVAVARVVNRTNAPSEGLKLFREKGMALAMMEELTAPSESKAPAYASEKAIMIVGAQSGTATITVTTADGKATPAILNLRVVDVNGDGNITAADITELYNYLLNGSTTYLSTSDITGDGVVTAADITAVYSLMLEN